MTADDSLRPRALGKSSALEVEDVSDLIIRDEAAVDEADIVSLLSEKGVSEVKHKLSTRVVSDWNVARSGRTHD